MEHSVPLSARTAVATLAERAVLAATASAMRFAGVAGRPQIEPDRVAVAYTSGRWVRVDGERPVSFGLLSAFFPTADGWVRTHANYPHLRTAAPAISYPGGPSAFAPPRPWGLGDAQWRSRRERHRGPRSERARAAVRVEKLLTGRRSRSRGASGCWHMPRPHSPW